MLKLFNRQGILQHTSEYVAGLEKQIAWKPSGTLIASSQMLPNKQSIIFFEKNGLKHRDFALPFEPHTFSIDQLAWSQDSEILLVNGFERAPESDGKYKKTRQNIMLFTTSNYHWYLKQRFQFDPSDFIEDILWDEQEYSLLHLLSQQCTYYGRHYNKPVSATDDGKEVLVIDGSLLQVSHFEQTLVPPPMCTYSIKFERQIIQVCLSKTGLLAVYLNGDQLVLLQSVSSTSVQECSVNPNDAISYNFTNVFADFTSVYRPLFNKKVPRIGEMLLPSLPGGDHRVYGLIDGQIACFDYKQPPEEISFLANISQPISALGTLSDQTLLLASTTGRLFCFDIEKGKECLEYSPKNCKVPVYDDRPLSVWSHTDERGESHIICHTVRNSLYYDHTLVLSCLVNSAMLYDNKYLLFSTTDSLFYCWPLDNFDAFAMNRSHPPRSLEKGARIVAASVSQAKVVLQLPRGNLEAFHPRLLVLYQVERYIRQLEFLRAFEILRKNRINLNFICDFDFALFTQNCDLFLKQIGEKHSDWICLFLTDLSEGNVLSTLNCGQTEVKTVADKVDTVCDLLREKMSHLDRQVYLNALLLTYIKKSKPEIDEALQVVKDLSSGKMRDSAIKFMLYVVSVNKLFDEALGTYDFDILLMVASKSNKDPKEYISLVNEFKAIEDEHYRRYRIDMHLQRYKSALAHLSRCGDTRFEEALLLIEEKHLFKEAIEIYALNESPQVAAKYSSIWNLYGDYLFKKKYYQEAAMAFRRAANHGQAFKMYLMESNWLMASVCARQLTKEKSEDEFEKLIQPVAQQLVLNGNFIDGAYIQEHYLHQPREAFLTLLKGREWEHALRVFHDHQLDTTELFEGQLLPELTDAYHSTVETIERIGKKLGEHLDRLRVVKESRLSAQESAVNGQILDAESDCYSDTSSILDSASVKSSESGRSSSSLKTNRSTKAKYQKRLEARKYVLKRGSPNEDIQLVYAIKEMMTNNGNILSDTRPLVVALYDLFMTQQSASLQRQLQQLHLQYTSIVEFIWKCDYFERRLAEGKRAYIFKPFYSFYFTIFLTF